MVWQATITETQRSVFEFAAAPAGWLALGGIALLLAMCYAVIWLYRRERRAGASGRLRAWLAASRCLVVLGLAAIWLDPVRATYVVRAVSAHVLVLADVSASMSVVDVNDPSAAKADGRPVADRSRLQLVQDLLTADDNHWLRGLHDRNELSLYAFGDATARLSLPWDGPATQSPLDAPPSPTAGSLAALRPTRPYTDLGQALATVLDDVGDDPVAGIVLLTDGGVNKGMSAEDLAAYAQRFKAPVYPVGVGVAREPLNLRVTSIAAPSTVPPGDPFELRVELAARGMGPAEVEVELTAELAGGGGETPVATRRVLLGADQALAPLKFVVDPPPPGEYAYRARVAMVDGRVSEAVTADNVRETPVEVLDRRLRVLVIAAGPSYEYRFVTRLLERDQSIDVSCWLQSADARAIRDGNTPIKALPREPEELFEYDAVLLLDPDPAELDAHWAVTLRRLVDEFGGGLLLEAGPHFTTRLLRDPRLQDVVSILPVTPDPEADLRMQTAGSHSVRRSVFELPSDAAGHPILTLHPEPTANRRIWNVLPAVQWYLPVLRTKPVATVLLQHAGAAQRNQYGPAVLMAVQPVGAGRTAYVGFNSTWRWRATAEPCFNRFWVQLVRYLARARRQQASPRGAIVLDRDSFRVGDYVRVEARLLDESYAPWPAPHVSAELEWYDGTRRALALEALPEREGWFAGRLLLDREGSAVIRIPLPEARGTDAEGQGRYLTKRLPVQPSDQEMCSLRLRADLLANLAEQTGGEYRPLAQARTLPDLIPRAGRRRPPQRTASEPLWDQPWVLGMLAALLAVEWTLRRRNHLL